MASNKLRHSLLPCAIAFVALSPADVQAEIPFIDQLTPGELRGIGRDPGDPWIYGYWEYLPTSYDDLGPGETLPLLVFLPGIGEYDDDSACPGDADVCAAGDCGNDGLCRNLRWGPQQHMAANMWDETLRPFIMISPQYDIPPLAADDWDIVELDAFIQFVVDNYPVDSRRMYLTGMSQGGRATLQYVGAYGRRFTAAIPLPGGVVAAGTSCSFEDTALWAFHGENDNNGQLGDGVFAPCNMVAVVEIYEHPELHPEYPACTAYVGMPRPESRITMFDNVGHAAWVPALDPIGTGFAAPEWGADNGCGTTLPFRQYTAALDSDGIYSWLLSLDRPDVIAPSDLEVAGDVGSIDLQAVTTDDDAVTYAWSQTAGPAATLTAADSDTLVVSDLLPETTYTFEVFVTDADDQWDRDEVTVTVLELPAGTSSGSTGMASDTGPTTGGSGGAGSTTDAATTTGTGSVTSDGSSGGTGAASDGSTGTASGGGTGTAGSGNADDASAGSTGSADGTNASTAGADGTNASTGGGTAATGASASGTAAEGATGSDIGSLDSAAGSDGSGTGLQATSAASEGESGGGQIDNSGGCGCVTDGERPTWHVGWFLLSLLALVRRFPAPAGSRRIA